MIKAFDFRRNVVCGQNNEHTKKKPENKKVCRAIPSIQSVYSELSREARVCSLMKKAHQLGCSVLTLKLATLGDVVFETWSTADWYCGAMKRRWDTR